MPIDLDAAFASGLCPLPGHSAAYLGHGIAARVEEALNELRATRVLVVHGRGSFALCGGGEIVERWGRHRTLRHFDSFRSNPDVEDLRAGVAVAREFRPDVVVGMWGGSALDMAKAIAVLAIQEAEPEECLRHPELVSQQRTSTLVLLPTTAGSGSEMTGFATIYIGQSKHSLDHPQVRADLVFVDPALIASVPMTTAVAAGLDALSQAIESYWAVAATDESRRIARAALDDLLPALGEVLDRGSCSEAALRTRLARGAAVAGAAINTTRTTAAHALSYDLTAKLGIPHGAAVALHLSWLLGHHARVTAGDCRHPGGPSQVVQLIDDIQKASYEVSGQPVEDTVTQLLQFGGYPADARALSLSADVWAPALTVVLTSGRAVNSPRVVTTNDVLALLS